MGKYTHVVVVRHRSISLHELHMGRSYGYPVFPHLRTQKRYQPRSALESVQDLGRCRLGGESQS